MDTVKSNELAEQGIMPVAIVSGTKFQTNYNRHLFPDKGEVNDLPSETIPDQSMSIRELVYRYTHGLSLGGGRTAVYDSESEVEYPVNWETMDISEKHDWLQEKTQELRDLDEQLKQEQNRLRKEEQEKLIAEGVEAKLKAIRDGRKEVSDEEPK